MQNDTPDWWFLHRTIFFMINNAIKIDLKWTKKTKQFTFIIPPVSWLYGDEEVSEEQIKEFTQRELDIQLTLNGVEWNSIGYFTYYGDLNFIIINLYRPIDYKNNAGHALG